MLLVNRLTRRPWLVLALVACTSCASVTIDEFEAHWTRGDYPAAEAVIDELIAREGDLEVEEVTASRGLSPALRASRCRGPHPRASWQCLRRARA